MKGNETKILLAMVVVAALLVFGAYNFFYSEDVAKAEQVENEIKTLRVRLDELNAKQANRAMYEAGITDSYDIIDTVLSIYGPGNTPEKTIMMIVEMCRMTGISVSNISFGDNSRVYASESTDENGVPDVQIFRSVLSLNVTSGYTQLKKLTDFINSYPERMNTDAFSATFSGQTGKLTIGMNVNLYSVTDKNHTYVAPVVEDIDLGNPNIFKTLEVLEEEEVEGEEGTEGSNETVENNEAGNTETNEAA